MALLQWLCYNGFVAVAFASPVRLCLQAKQSYFFMTGYSRKNRCLVKIFYAKENAKVAAVNFS